MRHANRLAHFASAFGLTLILAGAARAEDAPAAATPVEDAPAADAPAWSCETCPYLFGWQGVFDIGLFSASGATDWSSRDHGYADDGVHLDLNAHVMRLDEDGTRSEIVARDLGLDDRELRVSTGRAGTYEAGFDYWSKRWATAERAQTPFDGAGSGTLTLPPGWVRAGSTGTMTQLAGALHPIDMSTQRERVGAHGSWWSRHGWETTLEARHETKSGTEAIGGSFLTSAAMLPEPIDYTTESLLAAAAYGGDGWDVALRYMLSTFDSGTTSLEWDNPFLGLHPTADQGQMALAPDNEFQQISADARYRMAGGIRLEAGAAIGLGSQDATLLSATANPGLVTALPRTTADAEVATQLLFLRGSMPLPAGVGLRAELRYDSRQADTPQDSWTQVVTDTYIAAPRTNLEYGHDKLRAKVEGDWTVSGVRMLARLQRLAIDREAEAVTSTDEDQITLEAHGALFEIFDWGIEAGRDSRDGSAYSAPASPAAQNPLLRIYTYADMVRDRFAISVGAAPTASLSFALRLEQRYEDYDETQIGLTDRDDTGVGFDLSYAINDEMTLGAFYQRQTLATDQAGSTTWGAPDWTARSEDATEALGVNFVAPWVTDKLGLRAEFNLTETTGLVSIDQGINDAFPETLSKLRQFVVMADYRYSERIELRFGFRLERMEVADWALAGVAPDTVPSLLWTGQQEPDYELEVFELGMKIGL